jgi:hypothetical protein
MGFYHEGDKYPQVRSNTLNVVAKAAKLDDGQIEHMASAYVRLEPQLRPGGVRLTTDLERGRWGRQLILLAPDTLEIRSADEQEIEIVGWDRYEEIVLVLTSTEQIGFSFPYAVTAEYDPQLTDVSLPVAFQLQQNYPNPFLLGEQRQTSIPFALNTPSQAAQLDIFMLDGRLVRTFNLGPRAARSHSVKWDGRNDAGKLVGTGIYYYVLEVDGNSAKKKLAILREE